MKCYRVSVLRSVEASMEVWADCEDDAIDAALGYKNSAVIAEENECPVDDKLLESYQCQRLHQC